MIELIIKKLGVNGYDIYGISENRCLVREFINGLEGSSREKLWAILKRIAEHGHPRNIEKFRALGDGIFEIKSYQVRIHCFFEKGRMIILTHGFIKKSPKTPLSEIERAKRLRDVYKRWKGEIK
jgi:phage-related protein